LSSLFNQVSFKGGCSIGSKQALSGRSNDIPD
jgi:hypothetical protein